MSFIKALAAIVLLICCLSLHAQEEEALVDEEELAEEMAPDGEASAAELAKAAQNPIASLISVPIQVNMDPNWGPLEKTNTVTNIQPVLPFSLNDDWNLVTRTILPVVSQPGLAPGMERKNGISDMLFTAFFVPNKASKVTWGIGPAINIPTASNSRLGFDEWGTGVSFVALTMPGRWVIGGLVSNVWSVGADEESEFSLFTLQPFINYNLPKGWYLTFSPVITANWDVESDQRWTVPIGGGIGRVFRIGSQAMNAQAQYYHHAKSPDITGDWSIRLQLQFMFPR